MKSTTSSASAANKMAPNPNRLPFGLLEKSGRPDGRPGNWNELIKPLYLRRKEF
jgi:hypothetical protein